jgi:hypothetical protein
MPARTAVLGQHHDLISAGGQGGVGGVVARPVVDDHNLHPIRSQTGERGSYSLDGCADAGRLVQRGKHDRGPEGTRRDRTGDPLTDRAACRVQQHGPVQPEPHDGGDRDGTDLRREQGTRGAEALGGVEAAQHDHVDQTGQHGDDHERDGHPDPPDERIAPERHHPVQHVGEQGRDGERRGVRQHEDPSRFAS